jgi:hypothetical protein
MRQTTGRQRNSIVTIAITKHACALALAVGLLTGGLFGAGASAATPPHSLASGRQRIDAACVVRVTSSRATSPYAVWQCATERALPAGRRSGTFATGR